MKNLFRYLTALLLVVFLASCGDSEEPTLSIPDDTGAVTGMVNVLKTGTLSAQSGTNTKGMLELVTDEGGSYFVKLSSDFTTKFSTGTVTVYLSTSKDLILSESDSFQLVAVVNKAGEHFFKLPNFPNAKFSHGIIWCGAAGIPFGFAELK